MKHLWIFLFTLFLFTPVSTSADTLLIDSIAQTPADASGVLPPTRGMSMSQVRQKYGAASEQKPAVGTPPIVRWVYLGFTVYFENQTVLTSVINR